jgi:hypothetical protein
MAHGPHRTLPGYDERQIWFDGCDECEQRGKSVPARLGPLSQAELPLLRYLEYVSITWEQLRAAGVLL